MVISDGFSGPLSYFLILPFFFFFFFFFFFLPHLIPFHHHLSTRIQQTPSQPVPRSSHPSMFFPYHFVWVILIFKYLYRTLGARGFASLGMRAMQVGEC